MLVLARKSNQKIVIDGRIVIKVLKLAGPVVKLGIEAPPSVLVHRQEIYDEIGQSNKAATLTNHKRALNLGKPTKTRVVTPSPPSNQSGHLRA